MPEKNISLWTTQYFFRKNIIFYILYHTVTDTVSWHFLKYLRIVAVQAFETETIDILNTSLLYLFSHMIISATSHSAV